MAPFPEDPVRHRSRLSLGGVVGAAGVEASRTAALGAPVSIGIVIPIYNEACILEQRLADLRALVPQDAVIVVDGGSQDGSAAIAERFFPTEISTPRGRGRQMDCGAARLRADVVLFLHVDSRPPPDFAEQIRSAFENPAVVGGCFRLSFDDPHPLLRFYAWWTRFPHRYFHYGDQGFFVRRQVFEHLGGYRGLPFLEDVDFLQRLRRCGRFVILPGPLITSARRFRQSGILRQQLRNIALVSLAEAGVSPRRLARFYADLR